MKRLWIVGLLLAAGAAWGLPENEAGADRAIARQKARLAALIADARVAAKVAGVKGDVVEAERLENEIVELERRLDATVLEAEVTAGRIPAPARTDPRLAELARKAVDVEAAITRTEKELSEARAAGDETKVASLVKLLDGLTDARDRLASSRAAIVAKLVRSPVFQNRFHDEGGRDRLRRIEASIEEAKREVAAATDRGDFDTAARALAKARELVRERDDVRAAIAEVAAAAREDAAREDAAEASLTAEIRRLRADVAELRALVEKLRKELDGAR